MTTPARLSPDHEVWAQQAGQLWRDVGGCVMTTPARLSPGHEVWAQQACQLRRDVWGCAPLWHACMPPGLLAQLLQGVCDAGGFPCSFSSSLPAAEAWLRLASAAVLDVSCMADSKSGTARLVSCMTGPAEGLTAPPAAAGVSAMRAASSEASLPLGPICTWPRLLSWMLAAWHTRHLGRDAIHPRDL